ncbi:flavodoxin family protein [Chryseolinea lacunae]|uniref:Flavodoxin family protein n=1 Tax=Chryseolinea lacunae TaxID=2801331 RepID=A0ABS1KRX3_9BACT|nr:flavodoxin family protein [Chryseolinea lacunae]MBL0741036.1 flavodoxin family protein [Chryseolinea lacunae]
MKFNARQRTDCGLSLVFNNLKCVLMKTIIVYYSFSGNNEQLAKHLHEKLNCDILQLETVRKRGPLSIFLDILFSRSPAIQPRNWSMARYDRFIFVAPVWAGKMASPLRTFLREESKFILHYSFITVCGGGQNNQREALEKELASILETPPERVAELWVKEMLEVKKMDADKFTSAYRITPKDLMYFSRKIDDFVKPHTAVAL